MSCYLVRQFLVPTRVSEPFLLEAVGDFMLLMATCWRERSDYNCWNLSVDTKHSELTWSSSIEHLQLLVQEVFQSHSFDLMLAQFSPNTWQFMFSLSPFGNAFLILEIETRQRSDYNWWIDVGDFIVLIILRPLDFLVGMFLRYLSRAKVGDLRMFDTFSHMLERAKRL